jgi:hypothetical protein
MAATLAQPRDVGESCFANVEKKLAMSATGHSRRGRVASKPGHVRYAPVAIKFNIVEK